MQMAMGFTAPFHPRAAGQLCLADDLADSEKTAAQLAERTRCHASSLYGLLVIEAILPDDNVLHAGKLLDITMFAPTSGEERSDAEYRTLLEKANFKLNRAIATNSAVSIVEAMLRNSLPPNASARGTSPWRCPQVELHWNRKRVASQSDL
jgi:hypothetical protein